MPRRTELETLNSQELYESLSFEPAPINLHLYQPPRYLKIDYENSERTVFDITGKTKNFPGFNHQITQESYLPLTDHQILADTNVSWNLYGVTGDWLEINYPSVINELRFQIEKGAKPPVGDTYLHIILPFLSHEHKNMLLRISQAVYKQRWGVDPETIWLPESAVDSDTLNTLVENNYLGVHLREHQLSSHRFANLYGVNSGHGKILAITGNNHLSGKIGFDKPWADKFYAEWSRQAKYFDHAPRISIDGETLGHWWKKDNGAFDFTLYLLRYLREGYGWNNLDFKPQGIPDASLVENTSWSCLDSGLGRWTGSEECSCQLPSNRYEATFVRASKKDLFEKLYLASERLDASLDQSLPGWREVYIDWFLRQRISLATEQAISASFIGDKNLEKLFLSAYIRDLGWTSCGWFFGDVGGFERQIPANSLKAISQVMNWPDVAPSF